MASPIRFFKIILERSLQDGKLMIPRRFTRECSGNMSNPVVFKPPDATEWKIYWSKYESDIWFESGWMEFAQYYSLKNGYLVMFQYQETSNFEVQIYDMSSCEIKYPSREPQHKQHGDHIENDYIEILDDVIPTKKAERKSPTPCPQPHKKMRTTSTSGIVGGSSNFQHKLKCIHIDEETNNPNEREQIDQLTSKVRKLLNRAATFRSNNNPSFTVVMQHSYVYGRSMNIPSKFAKRYFKKNAMDLDLKSLDGEIWTVSYSIGRFYKGWNTFASDNQLKMLDVCLFELIRGKDICLKVRIFRFSEEERSFLSTANPNGASYIPPRLIPYFTSQVFTPTQVEEDIAESSKIASAAMKEARKFASKNPFFRATIKPDSHNDYRPCVPRGFMRDYLSNKKIALLEFRRILHPVHLHRYNVLTKLSKGWKEFMEKCNLKGGEVCVFELIKKEDAQLKVHIFRGQS